VTDAKEKETVVFFLVGNAGTPVLAIAYWEQGRIPVSNVDSGSKVNLGGMKDECFQINNPSGQGLKRQPIIGGINLKNLERRVGQILMGNRRECAPNSQIA
jgi:hypothetical protein